MKMPHTFVLKSIAKVNYRRRLRNTVHDHYPFNLVTKTPAYRARIALQLAVVQSFSLLLDSTSPVVFPVNDPSDVLLETVFSLVRSRKLYQCFNDRNLC